MFGLQVAVNVVLTRTAVVNAGLHAKFEYPFEQLAVGADAVHHT